MSQVGKTLCFGIGTLFFALAPWGSVAAKKKPSLEELVWPPGDPHVRLERVIQFRDDKQSAVLKFLDWFGGREQDPLFKRPYGVAWDGDELLVTDPGARRVVRISSRGRVSASSEGVVENPIGVAVCSRGVVVTDVDAGKVALLGPNLEFAGWLADGLARPTGVACSGDRIFVVETGKHQMLVGEPGGTWRSLGQRGAGHGEFNFPTSVAVDGHSLWVGDTLNFRIQRIDANRGKVLDVFGQLGDSSGEMPRIKGIGVDRDGHLWVSDAYLDQVAVYASNGVLLMSLGGTGVEPGEFSFPSGIAAHPDGRVAVVDSLNRRVQVFRLLDPSDQEP